MNAEDGRGQRQLPTPGLNPEAVDSLAWSPDGSHLAVTIFNEPGPDAHRGGVDGAGLASRVGSSPVRPGGGLDPAWSPDGAWLAYAAMSGGARDHVVAAATTVARSTR